MENRNLLPGNFYRKLYEEIMNYGFCPKDEADCVCPMGFDIGDFYIEVDALFNVEYDGNEMFSLQAGELEDISGISITFHDEINGYDVDVTNQFRYEAFWLQFKVFVIKRKGIYIKHGDEVLVKFSERFYSWQKRIYLYTDSRTGMHVCAKFLYKGKFYLRENFRYIRPFTNESLALLR